MKVSIIVPVYNVEAYLDQCISSIICQTYTDYELILVNDGSPDKCPQLCEAWAERDARIKVIHKQNGGLSDARNKGLESASGDYIIFVDGDDFWIEKDGLQNLIGIADRYPDCDFINFNCGYYFTKSGTFKRWKEFSPSLCEPVDTDHALTSTVASGIVPMSACLKLIKREVLSKIGLKFIKGIHCEDIPWFIALLEGSRRCIFLNQYIYAYRQNVSGSITASFGEKSFNDLLNIIKAEAVQAEQRRFSDDGKKSLLSFLGYEFCILLANIQCLPKHLRKESRKKLLEYRWLLEYTCNPKVKFVKTINRFCGIRLTEILLRTYMKHH